jgi:hypothetical protein
MTTATHAMRAMMSLRPRKRAFGASDRLGLPVAQLSITASLGDVLIVALFKLCVKRLCRKSMFLFVIHRL